MINVVISLIYTAYAMLQAEIEERQKKAADVSKQIKVLHMLDAAGRSLRDGDAGSLDGIVYALNKAVDATPAVEAVVIRKGETITADKQKHIDELTKKGK
jgi:hypothetical protein